MADSISIGAAYRDQKIVGGTIDNSPIGDTTRSTGKFTTFSCNGAADIVTTATVALGFHGATGVVQASAIATVVSGTAATTATYGIPTPDQAAIITALNSIIVALRNKGLLASS